MSHATSLDELAITLTIIGALFFLGLATDALGRRTALPRVTLLILLGALLGPVLASAAPPIGRTWFSGIAHIALVMVGFLLGGTLTRSALRERGRLVLTLSIVVVLATAAIVLVGLLLLGVDAQVALVLAAIATATDPAATADVVREVRAEGPFSRTLLGIVAVDDAWGLIAFSLLFAAAAGLGGDGQALDVLLAGGRELGGALLLGLALGVPAAYLTGRVRPGEPTLVEALGLVFLCSGIGLLLDVSILLTAMVIGAAVANLARHHTRPFLALETVEGPVMMLFFLFAGASLDLGALPAVGLAGAGYVVLRAAGRLAGAWAGGAVAGAAPVVRRWMGLALLPQAGVALAMALVVQRRRPDLGELVLPIVISATVLFEIAGPVFARLALERAGEGSQEKGG